MIKLITLVLQDPHHDNRPESAKAIPISSQVFAGNFSNVSRWNGLDERLRL
jgi:hypothetical protein